MQKKKQTKLIKQIIIFIAIIILLLLLVFAEDIIKLTNKNKLNLAENLENELISNEANTPQLSAGMIPVKWNGEKWIITTANDKDWYDYSKGKPAYIMLNDGYYQSELIRDMTNKELAENNVGVGVPDDPSKRGTIFMWIPRYAYIIAKEDATKVEIGYIKEETELSGEWIVPTTFSYEVADTTKPNFSLSGVWVEKDIDTDYANKMTQMNREESIYGFIANTKPRQITLTDINELQKYVGNDATVVPSIIDLTNINRIILQIINDKKHEPIKANITQNTPEGRLEIRVTYTANGIKEILDDYGTPMPLTEENGIIYTDTGNLELARGTYKFAVIDNKGNKKELSITPTINSLFKVAYINGTDNTDNTNTYTKTQETKTAAENTLINQLNEKDSSLTYSKAIKDNNGLTTVITQKDRTEMDQQIYKWNVYERRFRYNWTSKWYPSSSSRTDRPRSWFGSGWIYTSVEQESSTGKTYIKGKSKISSNSSSLPNSFYTTTYGLMKNEPTTNRLEVTTYYDWNYYNEKWFACQNVAKLSSETIGNLLYYILTLENVYEDGQKTDTQIYKKGDIAPKYTLQKYDSSLNLQSTYDVDTKILTTVPIDISNKGNNKVKLTLNTTGTNYKTYISNDNTNWQEVTEIISNTPKELNVDGWDNLFIKIETNTSRINNIDVAFYKD